MTNQSPRGGTELQFEYLKKHVDPKLLDQFQICTSVPEKIPLSLDKINILWQKNSWDQENLINWFQDKSNHHKYDWYVFNSNWNFEQFIKKFKLPTEKCLVIKNGIENIEPIPTIYKKGEPIKIIHHCTPWRGLSVLLGAMQLVKNPLITLDVYSSTEVYGKAFHDHNDHHYHDLYNQAKKLPNVNYIGYKPNEYILEQMPNYDMFVYPSIFEETSCASALEALASGVHVITNNFGALYETCAEWPVYINYSSNYEAMAVDTATAIKVAASYLHEDYIQEHLDEQQKFYKRFYNWDKKGSEWTSFLKGAISERNNK